MGGRRSKADQTASRGQDNVISPRPLSHNGDSDGAPPDAHAKLPGVRAWVITDGKTGSVSQATGIAQALDLDFRHIPVAPSGLYKLIAPFGPVDPSARFGASDSPFAPPWPDIALAIGRRSIPYLRAVKRQSPSSFCVVLLDPRGGTGFADLIWVPEHDRLRGPRVITTPTAPHGFSASRLAAERAAPRDDIVALPKPRVAVMLGGRNAVYRFSDDDHNRFARALASFARRGASFMVTASRRTHQELLEAARRATSDAPHIVFENGDDNPYAQFLSLADTIIVTGDSVSMTAEAAATGAPVFVFHPSQGSRKFARFHRALEAAGVARALETASADVPVWSYPPVDATRTIASEIARRFNASRVR